MLEAAARALDEPDALARGENGRGGGAVRGGGWKKVVDGELHSPGSGSDTTAPQDVPQLVHPASHHASLHVPGERKLPPALPLRRRGAEWEGLGASWLPLRGSVTPQLEGALRGPAPAPAPAPAPHPLVPTSSADVARSLHPLASWSACAHHAPGAARDLWRVQMAMAMALRAPMDSPRTAVAASMAAAAARGPHPGSWSPWGMQTRALSASYLRMQTPLAHWLRTALAYPGSAHPAAHAYVPFVKQPTGYTAHPGWPPRAPSVKAQ